MNASPDVVCCNSSLQSSSNSFNPNFPSGMTKRSVSRGNIKVEPAAIINGMAQNILPSSNEMPAQYIDTWNYDGLMYGQTNGWPHSLGVDQSLLSTNHMVVGDTLTIETSSAMPMEGIKQEVVMESITENKRKKRDRFNGMTEEEVLKRLLPDHLEHNLDIVIIGINPGLTAAYVGHHYAGPGNHFWRCLYLAGFIPQPMNAYDDYKLKDFGIGFTNIVSRTTRGSSDLTRKEIREGADVLAAKIHKYNPKIAVFNGKGIYEVFSGNKNFHFGKQPEPFPGTNVTVFVMPSSSARCSQLPRAVDKLPFYVALRQLRDHLRGNLPDLDLSTVTFPERQLKTAASKVKMDGYVKTEGDLKVSAKRVRAGANARASASRIVIKDEFIEPIVPAKRGRKSKQEIAMMSAPCPLPGVSFDLSQNMNGRLGTLPHPSYSGVEEQVCIKIEADEEEEERIMASTVESRVAHWVNTSPFKTSRPEIEDLGLGGTDCWATGLSSNSNNILAHCDRSSNSSDSMATLYSSLSRQENDLSFNNIIATRPENTIAYNGLISRRPQNASPFGNLVSATISSNHVHNSSYGGALVARPEDLRSYVTRSRNGGMESSYDAVSARKLLDGCAGVAAVLSRYRERGNVNLESDGFNNGMYVALGHIHP